jgi:Ser/Thr protein kinase RdoA (MazF antagonist)
MGSGVVYRGVEEDMRMATDHDESDATAVASHLLARLYPRVASVPVALEAIPDSSLQEGYIAYRVSAPATRGSPVLWVLRAHRARRHMPEHFRYFYPWVCPNRQDRPGPEDHLDDGACDMAAWLKTRAATLMWLDGVGYPCCPRVVPTGDGAPVGEIQGWCTLVTTFVPGTVLAPTLAQLRLLGSALGRLHALPIPAQPITERPIALVTPGVSYWHPMYAIPSARARLQATAPDVPEAWRPWHTAFEQTITQMQQADLPLRPVHGDAWSANAVADSSDEAILIDWDQGGQGPATADLGRLLLECHLDTDLPVDDALAWHIAPDPHRIEAVVEGYAQHRIPAPAELDALLIAMRFGVAFIGALHLDQALYAASTDPVWGTGMDRRFARLKNRFRVSEEIAALATAHFKHVARSSNQ